MLKASEAAKRTALMVEKMESEITKKLNEVIEASILQGSCKASFFPRNQFEKDKAIALLDGGGFAISSCTAKDQRDRDRIDIGW